MALVSIPSTVIHVNALGKIPLLSLMNFLVMDFAAMKQTMQTVSLMVLIVVDMMLIMMEIMTILLTSTLVIHHFAHSVFALVRNPLKAVAMHLSDNCKAYVLNKNS